MALRLVLPEVYLNGPDVDKRIETINASMDRYLADGLFRPLPDSLPKKIVKSPRTWKRSPHRVTRKHSKRSAVS